MKIAQTWPCFSLPVDYFLSCRPTHPDVLHVGQPSERVRHGCLHDKLHSSDTEHVGGVRIY